MFPSPFNPNLDSGRFVSTLFPSPPPPPRRSSSAQPASANIQAKLPITPLSESIKLQSPCAPNGKLAVQRVDSQSMGKLRSAWTTRRDAAPLLTSWALADYPVISESPSFWNFQYLESDVWTAIAPELSGDLEYSYQLVAMCSPRAISLCSFSLLSFSANCLYNEGRSYSWSVVASAPHAGVAVRGE